MKIYEHIFFDRVDNNLIIIISIHEEPYENDTEFKFIGVI